MSLEYWKLINLSIDGGLSMDIGTLIWIVLGEGLSMAALMWVTKKINEPKDKDKNNKKKK